MWGKKFNEKEKKEINDALYREYVKEIGEQGAYQKWIARNETMDLSKDACHFTYEPLISVVVPVYNVLDEQLAACVESVCDQTYANWELWLVDDCSTWESVRKKLSHYENRKKIHIVYRAENGNISVATNDGIDRANGEFIAFMDCDDTLAKNALEEMVALLNRNRELDFIYSDEDKLSADGARRCFPFFKPDWSPDTFVSMNYTNHLALYRTSIVKKTGGLRTEYNGAQDYDFTMRFMEFSANNRVGHVPKVLYHWRERAESTASNMMAKPYVFSAMKLAKEDMLKRRGLAGKLEFLKDWQQYNVVYDPVVRPKVSIVIPSKDNYEYLARCITSIRTLTAYDNYEILVVDNGSSEEQKNRIAVFLQKNDARYIYAPMEFNFPKMCNMGANLSEGEYLLLLNDDTEVLQQDWLERLLGQAMLGYAGAVGAKLLYPGGDLIQHIGVINIKNGPVHSFSGFRDSVEYNFGRNRSNYNWLAVTGACLMVSKQKYQEVGGLDESFRVAYNDVDFCFKLYEHGYYNSVRNDVRLYHYESVSRGNDLVDEEKLERLRIERNRLYRAHPSFKKADPFYNVNLVGDRNDHLIYVREAFSSGGVIEKPKGRQKENVAWYIDDVENPDGIRITGWIMTGSYEWDSFGENYILFRAPDGTIYEYSLKKMYRPDVAKVHGNDHYFTGFVGNINPREIKLGEESYRIGFRTALRRKSWWWWTDQKLEKKPEWTDCD